MNVHDRPPTDVPLPRPASQRSDIDPFIVMDVMRLAAEEEVAGKDIVHMEVGQPGTPAPAPALAAAKEALDNDRLGYTLALGLPELRERVSQYYADRYGCDVSADRVVVTTGSSAGFLLAFLAIMDAGEAVALPSPGYPCYRHILSALGCRPVTIETGPDTRWMPSATQLEAAVRDEDIKALLLASPANPTGTMLVGSALDELASTATRLGLWFISDEIYHGLDFTEPARTAASVTDNAIVINSFSKYFSMTGWRIGWMVVPAALTRVVERLAQNMYISPPTLSQLAATAAFDAIEEMEAHKSVYVRNRELLLNELPKAGFANIVPADGAFYLYADVGHLTDDSLALSRRILTEAGVAVTPGIDFDARRGAHFVRFSYAGSTADMEEAARRLIAWSQR